jgi:hypothetical protein
VSEFVLTGAGSFESSLQLYTASPKMATKAERKMVFFMLFLILI